MTRCPHFPMCSAPLCPEDANIEQAAWFPGEEVCKRLGVDFAHRQRRMGRAGISPDTCFTASMLKRNLPITKTLRGLDPERIRAEALAAWFARHKGRTPLSEEEKARRRERFQRFKRAG